MSDRYFVDTNILMYAHDTSAGAKHERAKSLVETLWRDRTGVVSTQVLQELSVNLRRKVGRPLDVKTTREIITDYLTWQVVVNGGESILEALDLEARYRISFWDALVCKQPRRLARRCCTPRTFPTDRCMDQCESLIRCRHADEARRSSAQYRRKGNSSLKRSSPSSMSSGTATTRSSSPTRIPPAGLATRSCTALMRGASR